VGEKLKTKFEKEMEKGKLEPLDVKTGVMFDLSGETRKSHRIAERGWGKKKGRSARHRQGKTGSKGKGGV